MSKKNYLDFEKLINGDKAAWDDFVEYISPVIYSAVNRTLKIYKGEFNEWNVAEIVQEIFIKLINDDYRVLKMFDPSKSSLVTWISIIARNKTIDFLRRKRPETVPINETYATHVGAVDKNLETAIESLDANNSQELFSNIPSELLTSRQIFVINLLFNKGMDPVEIAELLNINIQTVYSCKNKAIKRIRDFFEEGS